MFLRLSSLIIFFTLSLLAAPNLEAVKAAVVQNPALLDSPQAKALMKEKGINASDVKKKLAQSTTSEGDTSKTEVVENNLDTDSEKVDLENVDIDNVSKTKNLLKRLNPFSYKTSEELRQELNEKQQLLTRKKLSRYSSAFYANKNMIDSASLPTPENYTISTGDVINVHVYGDRNERYELEVSNEGEVELEFIGPVSVGGMSFSELKSSLTTKLKHHFKMSSVKITMSKYSSIQVTLIGDVKYPGIYNLSSFSTAKDLLIVSKGVRDSASVREIDIKRGGKTLAKLDFYDLLFEGKNIGSILLKHGDIVVVKKAKALVSIDGFVNHAAIFELKGKETLKTLIGYAGGMKVDASKRHIKIDRYSDNTIFETFNIPYSRAKNFRMKDGDKVYIYKLDSSANTSVTIYGNIIRPGAYSLNDESDLTQLLQKQLKLGAEKFFLPQTYFEYGVVKHYSSSSLNYETKSFNLMKVIKGEEKVELSSQDKIFIFSQNDITSSSYISTKGELLVKEGKLKYFEGMTIRDAVNASGINGVMDDLVRVTTMNTPDRMPKTSFYSYENEANITLSPYDEVEVYDYYNTHLLQPVSIKGEVLNPTTVFHEKGMKLSSLFDRSGGFTVEAFLNKVEIIRYLINEKNIRKKIVITLDLNKVDSKEYILEPYDEVTVYKIPNWSEKRVVTLKGEVRFPGAYTVSNGEKLSSVIQRAGGFTNEAFIDGAVFTRESIRVQQVSNYNRALVKVKRELAIYNAMPANSKQSVGASATSDTLNEVILEAQKYEPLGRVSINLDRDLESFKKGQFDLVLKDKDTLVIPNQIDTVTVFGEVFNSTSFVYNSKLDAEAYIKMASGLSRSADAESIYIIHADGRSELLSRGWFSASVTIQKGDTIVVPLYIKETNKLEVWDSVSRIFASFAITVATINTLGII